MAYMISLLLLFFFFFLSPFSPFSLSLLPHSEIFAYLFLCMFQCYKSQKWVLMEKESGATLQIAQRKQEKQKQILVYRTKVRLSLIFCK